MILGPVFERFIQEAPMPLMFRALLGRALDPAELDALFEALTQFTGDAPPRDDMTAVVLRYR